MNNQVNLIGYVGADPEIKIFDSGVKLAKFSVAVKEMPGTDKETTLWVQVEAWKDVADRVQKAITRGREVQVTGRLAVSTYTSKRKDGTEVEVERPVLKLIGFHLCGKKPLAESADALNAEASQDQPRKQTRAKSAA